MSTAYLQHKNGTIAYEDTGSGPLVVCAPSMGDLRAGYRFLTPLLVSAGYRVVTMDLRGHGETSKDWDDFSVAGIGSDLLALIRSLDSGPAVIIGTSMAAGAAVWAAAEGAEWIAALVLIGPFVRGETTWQNRLLYSTLFARPWGPALWKKYYTSLYTARKPADLDQYTAALKRNLQEKGRLEALKQMMLASKGASESRLGQVSQPVLVLMGSKDPDFKDPQAEASWVAEQLKGTYEMIPNAGHYPHAEMPEVAAPLITAFLAENQPAAEATRGA